MAVQTGTIQKINGNLIGVAFDSYVRQNEVAYAIRGEERLKAEVIRIRGNQAELQVFEDTAGLKRGDQVEFTGELLSVQVGPGLLGMTYDGLQNPLNNLAEKHGVFLKRGVTMPPLDGEKKWAFAPLVRVGDSVQAGDWLGSVKEGIFEHKIMVPFHFRSTYTVQSIAAAGEYAVHEQIAEVQEPNGRSESLSMVFNWPVKMSVECCRERILPTAPLVIGTRVIDTFFPVVKGGTFCIPGPFGAGKTVLQHITSRHATVDIVIVAACGERAGEVVELMQEFPELTDPRTGRSLMERTIIICNTSSMPTAAREASVYTAVALGEYYRQMGLDVLVLADSTSRWAQALREMSGKLEEIPGEEAFPAYLESRIAAFYERAGVLTLNNGETGSLTIGGTVSPAGGNFEEPVTQSTLKVVGAFHGLSKARADARRFPSIDPLDSWSKYGGVVDPDLVATVRQLMASADEVRQMMTVVGEEGVSLEDFVLYLKAELLDSVYLQQNAFDDVDSYCSEPRQKYVFAKLASLLIAPSTQTAKDAARQYFNDLRQAFVDWNYLAWDSDDFRAKEAEIDQLLESRG